MKLFKTRFSCLKVEARHLNCLRNGVKRSMTQIFKTLTSSSYPKARERLLLSPGRSIEIMRVTQKMSITSSSCHMVLEEFQKSPRIEMTSLTCTMEIMRSIPLQVRQSTHGPTLQLLLDIVNFHQCHPFPKDLYPRDISTTSTPSPQRHTITRTMKHSTTSWDSQKAIVPFQSYLITTARTWLQTPSSLYHTIQRTTLRTTLRSTLRTTTKAIRQTWYRWWTNQ